MEFSKSDRYSGAGHEYRPGIVRGLENRLTPLPPKQTSLSPDLYTVERRIPLFAIQYNSPSTGPPPFFPNRLLRAKAQGGIVARSSFPREGRGKEEGFYTSLEYLEPYVNADQALVQFCLFFPASLSAFIICPDLI